MTLPNIVSAKYNAATGMLTLNGSHFSTTSTDYKLTDLSLKGDAGVSYTLTADSSVSTKSTSSHLIIKLSTLDQLAVDGLLNKNGAKANDASHLYNFTALDGWFNGATSASTDVTVSGVSAPTITSVKYNAQTGVFSFTGNHLCNQGSNNGIALTHFSLKAGNSSFNFNGSDNVNNLTSTAFSVKLSVTDQGLVNAIIDKNGISASNGSHYYLKASSKWDSDFGVQFDSKPVSVNNVAASGATQLAILSEPSGIGVDSAGNVYVSSLFGNTIQEISAGNHNVTTAINGDNLTLGVGLVASNPNGDVYFATNITGEFGFGNIKSGDNTSSALVTSNLLLSKYAVDNAGNVYILENLASVGEIAVGSSQITTIAAGVNGLDSALVDISVDGKGNVYTLGVTTNGGIQQQVQEISADTHKVTSISLGVTTSLSKNNVFVATSMCVDKAGNIYLFGTDWPKGPISAPSQDAIEVISAGSHATTVFNVPGVTSISGSTIDNAGHLYAYTNLGAVLEIVGIHPHG